MHKKVLIAMSGGVDSSVAAFLLKQQGYDCIGCTMKLYENEEIGVPAGRTCCSLSDVEDAKSVACRLDIPYYVFDYTSEFKTCVIDKFANAYLNGQTPNPCIECNRCMKFDLLYHRAALLGCDYIATGHYAIVKEVGGRYELHKGLDASKDQSYVLYPLTQKKLAHTLFPLGKLTKAKVREIAEKIGFLNADKPDSQDICFVPDGNYAKVVERVSKRIAAPGNFVDKNGNILGRHRGIIYYTVGQRKGLGIALAAPSYVCKIAPEHNEILLGSDADLYSDKMTVAAANWICSTGTERSFRCEVKIRYRGPQYPCTVWTADGNTVTVLFDTPARAVTPGQSAVFYRGTQILGGGIIQS